jgi:hypothetical protein
VPFGGSAYGTVFIIHGRPNPGQSGDWPLAHVRTTMTPGYLQTLGIPLLSGRDIDDRDRAGAPPVAVINQSLAEKYWPGQDAVGARIQFPGQRRWMTVVGVAGDTQWSTLLESRTTALYVPLSQWSVGATRVVVRGDLDATALAASLRGAVWAIDRDTPVSDVADVADLVAGSAARAALHRARRRALCLGRPAAGGDRRVRRARARGDAPHAGDWRAHRARGTALRRAPARGVAGRCRGGGRDSRGLAGAAVLGRLLRTLLVGVAPVDAPIYAASAATLVCVAMIAAWLSARRATRIDPAVALRTE